MLDIEAKELEAYHFCDILDSGTHGTHKCILLLLEDENRSNVAFCLYFVRIPGNLDNTQREKHNLLRPFDTRIPSVVISQLFSLMCTKFFSICWFIFACAGLLCAYRKSSN